MSPPKYTHHDYNEKMPEIFGLHSSAYCHLCIQTFNYFATYATMQREGGFWCLCFPYFVDIFEQVGWKLFSFGWEKLESTGNVHKCQQAVFQPWFAVKFCWPFLPKGNLVRSGVIVSWILDWQFFFKRTKTQLLSELKKLFSLLFFLFLFLFPPFLFFQLERRKKYLSMGFQIHEGNFIDHVQCVR